MEGRPAKRKGMFSACFGSSEEKKEKETDEKKSEEQRADVSPKLAASPAGTPEPATTVVVVGARHHDDGERGGTGGGKQHVDQKQWVQDFAAKQENEQKSRGGQQAGAPGASGRGSDAGRASKGGASGVSDAMTRMVSRSKNDAYVTFQRYGPNFPLRPELYDSNNDGYLTRQDLYEGLKELNLGLTPEMYRQYIDCNFMYADMDNDGRLSLDEYSIIHGMINEVRRKFQRSDKDGDGLINKKDFTRIVKELHLNLNDEMCAHYVDINFRYVDRNFRGTITFGQFLACYANFLISHALMHPKIDDDRPLTAAAEDLGGGPLGGHDAATPMQVSTQSTPGGGYTGMKGATKGPAVQNTMVVDDLDDDVETIFVNGPL